MCSVRGNVLREKESIKEEHDHVSNHSQREPAWPQTNKCVFVYSTDVWIRNALRNVRRNLGWTENRGSKQGFWWNEHHFFEQNEFQGPSWLSRGQDERDQTSQCGQSSQRWRGDCKRNHSGCRHSKPFCSRGELTGEQVSMRRKSFQGRGLGTGK